MENIKDKAIYKIIDWIAFETGGRLVASKSESGYDLFVQKKGDYSGKKVFLNVEILKNMPENKISFPENTFLLCVNFDLVKQKLDDEIFLLPAFKEKIDKKTFIDFLIKKLITENRAAPHQGFERKTF